MTIHVDRTEILTTTTTVFTAWEPSTGDHSTIKFEDGKRFGQVSSRCVPDRLDALPAFTKERLEAVQEWHQELYERAYEAILEAHPELTERDHKKEDGRIVIHD